MDISEIQPNVSCKLDSRVSLLCICKEPFQRVLKKV